MLSNLLSNHQDYTLYGTGFESNATREVSSLKLLRQRSINSQIESGDVDRCVGLQESYSQSSIPQYETNLREMGPIISIQT